MSIGGGIVVTFLVSAIQGLSQLAQYRNNAKLVYPSGLTVGLENSTEESSILAMGKGSAAIANYGSGAEEESSLFTSVADMVLGYLLEDSAEDDADIVNPFVASLMKKYPISGGKRPSPRGYDLTWHGLSTVYNFGKSNG